MQEYTYQYGFAESILQENSAYKFLVKYHQADSTISSDLYSMFNAKANQIFDFNEIHIQWRVLNENYSELLAHLKTCERNLNSHPSYIMYTEKHLESIIKITQLLTNTLTSAVLFLNISEAKLKKFLANDKSKFNDWNNYRKLCHKENFSYRFLYELRNYAQHNDIPLSDIGFDADNFSIKEFTILISVNESFLKNYKWGKLHSEISSHTEINILKLLTEYTSIINKIYKTAIDIYKSDIHNSLLTFEEIIREYASNIKNKNKIQPIIIIREKNEYPTVTNEKFEHIPLPLYLINHMNNDWIKILNFDIRNFEKQTLCDS